VALHALLDECAALLDAAASDQATT
jgi:hypothetical protein